MSSSTGPEDPSPGEESPGHVRDRIGRRPNARVVEADAADPDTRPGLVLLRLKAAPLDAEAERQTWPPVTVDGLGHEDAAAILGCQVGTVKGRVSRVRARLASARRLS